MIFVTLQLLSVITSLVHGELCIICMRYDENVNQNILNDGDCLGHGTALTLRGPDQVAMGISE